MLECVVWDQWLIPLGEHASQSELLILEKLACERQQSALLKSQDAHVELLRVELSAILMFHKGQQLVKSSSQLLVLFLTFREELGAHDLTVNFNHALVGLLTLIKHQSQVVECLLLEALVLCEGRKDLSWDNLLDWLQKVEESNIAVLIRVKQLHVLNHLQIHILVREVEQLTLQKD